MMCDKCRLMAPMSWEMYDRRINHIKAFPEVAIGKCAGCGSIDYMLSTEFLGPPLVVEPFRFPLWLAVFLVVLCAVVVWLIGYAIGGGGTL